MKITRIVIHFTTYENVDDNFEKEEHLKESFQKEKS
jgi:hypothetical protein